MIKGEGRPGNDPVDRFSHERAKPRTCSSDYSGRRRASSRACCGWRGWIGRYRIALRCAGVSGPWRSGCLARDRRGRCICRWTAPGSRSAARGAQGPWPPTGPRKPAARHTRKHGGARRRVWRNVHLDIDEGEEEQERPQWGVSLTNMEVRVIEVTDSRVGPAGVQARKPADRAQRGQVPEGEPIGPQPHGTSG